jgi:flagellar L-ring protein precursor FlgH
MLACAWLSTGCVRHVKPYKPKKRNYKFPQAELGFYENSSRDGSLFDKNSRIGTDLVADNRARHLHDIVNIVVREKATSSSDASTELDRASEMKNAVSSFLGYMKAVQEANPNTDPTTLIDATSVSKFAGSGKTTRSGQMEAIVPGMIKKVLPNGLLFIEGQRVVLLNDEENHFYISGVIRPSDIDPNNRIVSTQIAEAQVEFTGRGQFDLREGWFQRFFSWMWPF